MIDARYEKMRRGGSIISQGGLVVIGISATGYREVLGCWVAESETSWGAVFAELKQRGLIGGERRSSGHGAGHRAVFPRRGVALPSAFRAQRVQLVRPSAASAGAADDEDGDRSADSRGRHCGAGRGGVEEEGSQSGAATGGARRRDFGSLRPAGGASQAHAHDEYAGAEESGVEVPDARGTGVSIAEHLQTTGEYRGFDRFQWFCQALRVPSLPHFCSCSKDGLSRLWQVSNRVKALLLCPRTLQIISLQKRTMKKDAVLPSSPEIQHPSPPCLFF